MLNTGGVELEGSGFGGGGGKNVSQSMLCGGRSVPRSGLEYSVEESVYWEVESVYNISVYLL